MSVLPTTDSSVPKTAPPSSDSALSKDVQAIKKISVLILGALRVRHFPKLKGREIVQISPGSVTAMEYFENMMARQDVVFLPKANSQAAEVLWQLGYVVHQTALGSLIALNRNTWEPEVKRVTIHPHAGQREGLTIVATQRDGRSVLLSCGNFQDETAFKKQMSSVHESYRVMNKNGMEDLPQGWTYAIAGFRLEAPVGEACFPSAHWHWWRPGEGQELLGVTGPAGYGMTGNDHLASEGITQRKILWGDGTVDDSPEVVDDIVDV